MIETASWLRDTFGNPTLEVQDIVAEGDRVVIRALCRGKHVGELMGIPPTGKSFEVQQFHEYRIQDGQIAEHWACRDDVGMMRQLGSSPTGRWPASPTLVGVQDNGAPNRRARQRAF